MIFVVWVGVDLPGLSRYNTVTLTVRVDLRIPDDLHASLKAAAEAAERSLHGEVLWRLRVTEPGVSVQVGAVDRASRELVRVPGPVERTLRGLGGEDAELSVAAPPAPAVSSGRLAASSPPSPPLLDGVEPAGSTSFKPDPKPERRK